MAPSSKSIHARKINSFLPITHEIWASKVLNTPRYTKKGPDLWDYEKFIEIKSALVKKSSNRLIYPSAWTIQDHQVEYNEYFTGIGYWGFILYQTDTPIENIELKDSENYDSKMDRLDSFITKRELYLTTWDWIYQFPPSHCKGKTFLSEWENDYRYALRNNLPKTKRTKKVKKGLIHFTEGVDIDLFS